MAVWSKGLEEGEKCHCEVAIYPCSGLSEVPERLDYPQGHDEIFLP